MKQQLPREAYRKNAEVYRLMANPKRLAILNALAARGRSYEELLEYVRVPKANLSQHLSVLRSAGLVSMRRVRGRVFYSIVDPRIVAPCRILHELRLSAHVFA